MQKPLISVIIPIYNAQSFLEEAVESIAHQTYSNIEIILIDDCSTDSSGQIAEKLKGSDSRIKLLHNATNQGIAKTRNNGLRIALGEYYAPMDADDVSEPERIAEELDFLIKNPSYVVVGSQITLIDEKSNALGYRKYPISHQQIVNLLPRKSPFAQSSTLIRMDAMKNACYYGDEFSGSEDYELWCKLSGIGKLANLAKPLLRYRISPNQNKFIKLTKTLRDTVAIQNRYVRGQIVSKPYNLIYHLGLRLLIYSPKPLIILLFILTQLKSSWSKSLLPSGIFALSSANIQKNEIKKQQE